MGPSDLILLCSILHHIDRLRLLEEQVLASESFLWIKVKQRLFLLYVFSALFSKHKISHGLETFTIT